MLISLINSEGVFVGTKSLQDVGRSHRSRYIIASLGSQSSGKSTLLNAMYKLKFPTQGEDNFGHAETKGLWMSNGEGVTVLDLEGTDSLDRNNGIIFERKLGLLALALSDVLVVNVEYQNLGRRQGSNRDLLRALFLLYIERLHGKGYLEVSEKEQQMKKILYIVVRDTPRSNRATYEQEKLNEQKSFQSSLDTLWSEVSKASSFEGREMRTYFDLHYAFLSSFIDFPELFTEEVQTLRKSLQQMTASQSRFKETAHLIVKAQQLWKVLDADLGVNLERNVEIEARIKCCRVCSRLSVASEIKLAALVREKPLSQSFDVHSSLIALLDRYQSETEEWRDTNQRSSFIKYLIDNYKRHSQPYVLAWLRSQFPKLEEQGYQKLQDMLSERTPGPWEMFYTSLVGQTLSSTLTGFFQMIIKFFNGIERIADNKAYMTKLKSKRVVFDKNCSGWEVANCWRDKGYRISSYSSTVTESYEDVLSSLKRDIVIDLDAPPHRIVVQLEINDTAVRQSLQARLSVVVADAIAKVAPQLEKDFKWSISLLWNKIWETILSREIEKQNIWEIIKTFCEKVLSDWCLLDERFLDALLVIHKTSVECDKTKKLRYLIVVLLRSALTDCEKNVIECTTMSFLFDVDDLKVNNALLDSLSNEAISQYISDPLIDQSMAWFTEMDEYSTFVDIFLPDWPHFPFGKTKYRTGSSKASDTLRKSLWSSSLNMRVREELSRKSREVEPAILRIKRRRPFIRPFTAVTDWLADKQSPKP